MYNHHIFSLYGLNVMRIRYRNVNYLQAGKQMYKHYSQGIVFLASFSPNCSVSIISTTALAPQSKRFPARSPITNSICLLSPSSESKYSSLFPNCDRAASFSFCFIWKWIYRISLKISFQNNIVKCGIYIRISILTYRNQDPKVIYNGFNIFNIK